jgi:hypothetical protein
LEAGRRVARRGWEGRIEEGRGEGRREGKREEERRREEEGGGKVRTVRRGEGGRMCTPGEGIVSLIRVTIYITFINIYHVKKFQKPKIQKFIAEFQIHKKFQNFQIFNQNKQFTKIRVRTKPTTRALPSQIIVSKK